MATHKCWSTAQVFKAQEALQQMAAITAAIGGKANKLIGFVGLGQNGRVICRFKGIFRRDSNSSIFSMSEMTSGPPMIFRQSS